MDNFTNFDKQVAIQDFRDARRKAAFQSILSFFTGKEQHLLRFDDVKKKLHLVNRGHQVLDYIELDSIVGSVGRYKDFDRNFLPINDSDFERWTNVRMAMTSLSGVPPIEVYQIGDVYFVLDGNHRVSASRAMGNDRIEAFVTKFNTPISLTADDNLDDLLIKTEYADFLNKTKVKSFFPELNFTATAPGRYKYLIKYIEIHRYFLGINQKKKIEYSEAVKSWVETVYLPGIHTIRTSGILRDFPDRTETDLYLWLLKHKEELEKSLGWQVNLTEALKNLQYRFGRKKASARVSNVIKETFMPVGLDAGPETGAWRKEATAKRTLSSLFASILVPLSRNDTEFNALRQSLDLAKKEGAIIRGLVVLDENSSQDDPIYQKIEKEFYHRCKESNVSAQLVYDAGNISHIVSERASWNDLVVLHLFHPPEDDVISRLRSGLREIIQRSPRPVLVVPNYRELKRIMVAFDDSPKSKEALYIAAYLTTMLELDLFVITNADNRRQAFRHEQKAKQIIERYYIKANYINSKGIVKDNIVNSIRENKIDLLLMGGYSNKPLMQMMVGSTVDHMLRELSIPIIICR